MKYILVLIFIIIQYIPTKTIAQSSEVSASVLGINSINQFTNKSDRGGPIKVFWSPTVSLSVEYIKTNVFRPNVIFHTSIGVVGMYNNVSVRYNNLNCNDCQSRRASSTGDLDIGIRIGIGKRFDLMKMKKLNIIGGILLRRTAEGFRGGRSLSCNDVICTRIVFNQRYTIKGWLHPSLYTNISWPFYTTKKKDFNIRLVLTYTQGLTSVYKFSSYVRLIQENEEYNYELENKGSFFGIGFSVNRLKY